MEHLPLKATKKQRENLKKLADYLATGETSMKFDMANYCEDLDGEYIDPYEHTCGSVACAVGHGPASGIAPNTRFDSWVDYCDFHLTSNEDAFQWMFGGCWDETDNTPQGAASRIYYALDNGIPLNHRAQMMGQDTLTYTVIGEAA